MRTRCLWNITIIMLFLWPPPYCSAYLAPTYFGLLLFNMLLIQKETLSVFFSAWDDFCFDLLVIAVSTGPYFAVNHLTEFTARVYLMYILVSLFELPPKQQQVRFLRTKCIDIIYLYIILTVQRKQYYYRAIQNRHYWPVS